MSFRSIARLKGRPEGVKVVSVFQDTRGRWGGLDILRSDPSGVGGAYEVVLNGSAGGGRSA